MAYENTFQVAETHSPKTTRNKPSTKVDMEALGKDVEEYPDHYQYERAEKFGVGQSTMYHILCVKTFGWSAIKKTLFYPEADKKSRIRFQEDLYRYEFIEKRPIIYVDKSGFSVDALRDRGYSLKGKKCFASKDWHAGERVNAVGAINNFKLFNVCLFNSNINTDIFYAWLTQELLPNIPKNL